MTSLGPACFTSLTRGRGAGCAPSGRSHSPSTEVRDLPRCGCIWALWGRSASTWAPKASSPSRRIDLVDNDDTALEFTDLVFIDPVTTGFSRAAPGEKDAQFHGFEGDLESVGEFIRLYLTRFERWGSPKFLAGESYGTTRSAALSQYLLDNDGIYLNGITLISTVLNFETISFAPWQRSSVRVFPAHLHRCRVVSQKTSQRSARRLGESSRRSPPLRGQRIQRGADERR